MSHEDFRLLQETAVDFERYSDNEAIKQFFWLLVGRVALIEAGYGDLANALDS